MAKKSQQLAVDTRPWRDPGNNKPFVRIKNVTKKFGDVLAVHDVSLDIYRSELFCLLGGSGSGKSTLLRMLAGFESPSSGTIEIDGQDMTDVAPYNRPVNMMFQSYALFPHMSVEQNIAYGLKRDHLPKGEINDRVAELLSLVKLQDYGRRKPHQLSGGQRQRVALARALAKRPKLLLLDEPLGALDKKLREETQFELVKIQESLGVTFIVVTHDQEEAMTLATRIGVMNLGEIAMIGEPTDIYEFPNSRFVAGFIGSVNMVEGVVTEDEPGHVRIRSSELGCDIYVGHGVDCAPEQLLWWAVRPEKMVLSREKPHTDHGANVTTGTVEEIAYLGDISVYQVALESGKRIRVSQTNSIRGKPDAITWEEKVYLSWDDQAGSVLTV
ncbi:putrescine transport system ATP-binding protein [Devosia crocina]|uniref:Spermidine/putrescine import ATP-binding protein PotA n=1 Tax=Devosia crocina TaxID=429728 RepID=A0A1I7NR67_9HYPH|nr:polyamine ABC transporter ATP-binding protein [Devosia crocina]SFV37184.1 putrescine transport system ATP-binding protein [Devosia crocina]